MLDKFSEKIVHTYLTSKRLIHVDKGRKLNVRNVQDVFWTSFGCSIYVQCLRVISKYARIIFLDLMILTK